MTTNSIQINVDKTDKLLAQMASGHSPTRSVNLNSNLGTPRRYNQNTSSVASSPYVSPNRNITIGQGLLDRLSTSVVSNSAQIEQWMRISQRASTLRDELDANLSRDNGIHIRQLQEAADELIDLQMTSLEDLSHDIVPQTFLDQKQLHQILHQLKENVSTLQQKREASQIQVTAITNERKSLETQLNDLQHRLQQVRSQEADLTDELHRAAIALSQMEQQMVTTSSMKNQIDEHLSKLQRIENDFSKSMQTIEEEMKRQWTRFEARWRQWSTNDIASWICHHDLQLQYGTDEIMHKLNELNINNGTQLQEFGKNDWIALGISHPRDRATLRTATGVLTAPIDIPEHFRCPVTKKLMDDPVIAADGYTYDRRGITEWFNSYDGQMSVKSSGKYMSPVTGETLTTKMLFCNHQLAKQIVDFKSAHGMS